MDAFRGRVFDLLPYRFLIVFAFLETFFLQLSSSAETTKAKPPKVALNVHAWTGWLS